MKHAGQLENVSRCHLGKNTTTGCNAHHIKKIGERVSKITVSEYAFNCLCS